jgi:hypothetical protein
LWPLGYLVAIWYIFPVLVYCVKEKSGNPVPHPLLPLSKVCDICNAKFGRHFFDQKIGQKTFHFVFYIRRYKRKSQGGFILCSTLHRRCLRKSQGCQMVDFQTKNTNWVNFDASCNERGW